MARLVLATYRRRVLDQVARTSRAMTMERMSTDSLNVVRRLSVDQPSVKSVPLLRVNPC